MISRKLYSLLIFLLCLAGSQEGRCQLNLNIRNGLPSNHVYQMLKDKYGYLWMATTNGVVRYNGYELKNYTIADGLPSNDVWSIHLDKWDRLWLLCYTNTPGYIYKNKYHETYVKNYNYSIAANRIAEYHDGIAFTSKFQEATGHSLFREKNDTVVNVKNEWSIWWFYVNNKAEFILGMDDSSYTISTYGLDENEPQMKQSCTYDSSILFLKKTLKLSHVYYNYEIFYNPGKNIMYNLNLSTCRLDTILFPNPITKVIWVDKNLYILAGDNAYKLDSSLKTIYSAPVTKITNGFVSSADDMVYLLEDNFWGKSIATQTNGIFILPWKISPFKKLNPFNDIGYKYIGAKNDSVGYWWNKSVGTIAFLNEDGTLTYQKLQTHDEIRKIIPFRDQDAMLFFNYAPSLITIKNLRIHYLNLFRVRYAKNWFRHDVSDALIYNDSIYTVNSTGFHKSYISNDTLFSDPIYNDRFTGVVYDSLRKLTWGYNPGKIVVYRSGKVAIIPNKLTRSFGVTRFEQVLLDNRYGNIFVKDGDKLWCIDPKNYTCRQLFSQCNLADAKLFIQDNTLIVAGKFGVLFSKIRGVGQLSKPVVYFNDKYNYYLSILGVQVSKRKILLNTDNGLYAVDLPHDADYRNTHLHQPFTLILTYADELFNVQTNDSISINQENRKFIFDVIKPSGSGQVKYQYMLEGIDSSWHELANNELSLTNFPPGKYHTLLLKVRDDVWRSNTIRLHVYAIPHWWQVNPGRTILWLLGMLLLGGVILATVLITRKIITQNNIKKNRLLELEIKSIYSQINPHFIFNTLNTTLHYIVKKKLDEAYDHVSSFSSLLRSYLKSSRNRYIPLGEEIANLRNYIHLQQTRFENAFTYEIITDIPNGRTIDIPSLLLQPIVENAINHGLLPKNSPGHLKLAFIADSNTNAVTCVIDDNGIGRKHAGEATKHTERESYGSQLIAELVDIFNKYENAGIEIKYIDKELPERGTTVIITIKNARTNG